MLNAPKNSQITSFEPDSASKAPLETAQSEQIKSHDSPIKIHLESINKTDPNEQQLAQEIKELEAQVRQMRQTLEELYKKQRDLANERAKLKQRF